jgi:hypothetical protein
VGQEPLETITVYVPVWLGFEMEILGFCTFELKLFGPVQVYVTAVVALCATFKLKGWPAHTVGLGLLTVAEITPPGRLPPPIIKL